MRKMIMLLVVAGVLWHYRAQLPWSQSAGAFNPDGSPAALLLTADFCGKPCEDMEKHLDKLHVPYQRQVIAQDNNEQIAQLHAYTGGANSLPVLVMGNRIVSYYHPGELPFDVADVLGLDYLPKVQARIIRENHFNADGSKKIVMYATDWCPVCDKARTYMTQQNIAFQEIDVEKSPEGKLNFKALDGNGYPYIFAGARSMSGFDENRIRQMAGL